jgi:hypothetical protein
MRYCLDTSAWFSLPSSGYRGRPFPEPCGSPPSRVVWSSKTARRSVPATSGLPWQRLTATSRICSLHSEDILATSGAWFVCLGVNHTPIHTAEIVSSPAFAGSLFESMPRTRDPGDPDTTRLSMYPMQPSARLTASASQRKSFSGLNTRGLLSHCVRFDTRQSPGEWQHSLLARPLRL